MFEKEWIRLWQVTTRQSRLRQETSADEDGAIVDGRFLMVHCPLQEISAAYLPILKKAVAATNTSYKPYTIEQATELEQREDVWKQERKTVNDLAESLLFD